MLLALPALALAGNDEREIPDEEILAIEQKLNLSPIGDIERRRNYDMEIGLRRRSVSVPKSILDIWFFDQDDWQLVAADGFPADEIGPRPSVKGVSTGIEFVVKGATANGLFWFDYFDSNMGPGFWDDVEESDADPIKAHTDGDYLVPSPNLGMAAFGADYGYEVHIVRTDMTRGYFGLSLLVGSGLGMGVMVGTLERWKAEDSSNNETGFDLYVEGEPPTGAKKNIPKVFPIVDVNAGLRMNFADRVVVRFEGGLHTLVYWGGSVGYMF